MKRIFSLLAAAAMLLCLCACSKTPSQPEAPATVYDDSLISQQLSLAGEYDDDVGNHVTYSYQVPQINSDSADAAAINAALKEKFGGYVNDEMVAIGSETSLVCTDIYWQSYWHDSLLCLVVTAETDWDFTDYGVYSFDFASGKAVSGTELAAMAGLDEEELLKRAQDAAAAAFDEGSAGMPRDDFYNQQREWTLSEENISVDMLVYINDAGNLTLILPIASFAGGSWYYHVIEIEA